jgi:hypothetical protein
MATSYTDTGLTGTYTNGAPITGPMYNPPGGGKPIPLSQYNAADPNDPTGQNVYNPTTGLNPQGLTPGQQAAKNYTSDTAGVNTTKSQPIQNAVNTTLSNEGTLQNTEMNSFNQYLAQAQQQLEQEQASVTQDQATMNQLPAELNSELSSAVQNFANTGSQINAGVTALNKTNADTVNTNITNLASLDQQQQAAAQAAAAKAVGDAQARNNAMQSATGTPRSAGGYQEALAANTEAGIMLPVTAAGYQQQIGQLQNYVTPQQQQLYSQQVAQLTGLQLPLAQTLVNLGITNSSQVAQLQAALAGKTLSEQVQMFAQLGVPVELAQQLAQSLPSAVGQLNSTNLANNQYGLVQNYQNPVSGGLPAYAAPMPSGSPGARYASGGAGGFQNTGPVTAGPTALPATAAPATMPTNAAPGNPYQPSPGQAAADSYGTGIFNTVANTPYYNPMDMSTPDLGTVSSYQ